MNFLKTILKQKRDSVQLRKKILPQEILLKELKRPFKKSRFKKILQKPGMRLIAEIKRASPSKGDIRKDLDVAKVAKSYENAGVELVSILTEEKFFKGNLRDLLKVKQNTKLSILCKDFVIDEYQIYEAKLYGAEAVLLIARILSRKKLQEFIKVANKLCLDSLVEIHDADDLKKISGVKDKIDIIGINHRNLQNFKINLRLSDNLILKIPKGKIIIAESGIKSASQIKRLKEKGFKAVLVGESIMRQKNIEAKLKELIRATR